MQVTWEPFNDSSIWNGLGLGYELQYRLKRVEHGRWNSVVISGVSINQYVVTGLFKYSIYKFKVAGRTSIGSGLFGEVKEERTMEDGTEIFIYLSDNHLLKSYVF